MNAGSDLIALQRKFVVEMTRLTGRTADEPVLRGQLCLGPRTPHADPPSHGLGFRRRAARRGKLRALHGGPDGRLATAAAGAEPVGPLGRNTCGTRVMRLQST
jgi:hypothetical protein